MVEYEVRIPAGPVTLEGNLDIPDDAGSVVRLITAYKHYEREAEEAWQD